MKYLHVCPPWYVFYGENRLRQPNVPLGAGYCARAALRAGWQAFIWNGDLLPRGAENEYSEEMSTYHDYLANHAREDNPVWEELRRTVREIQPDTVGITALTASYPSALRAAAVVKEEDPHALVVLGGPHPSAEPEAVASAPHVDVAVVGEGGRTLEEILRAHRAGVGPAGIPGTVVWSEGAPRRGPRRQLEPNLDALGWPARGAVLDRYGVMTKDNLGLVMYSRGCPYPCEFCASSLVWTRAVRWRSPRNLAAEMAAIHQEYDTRYFSFEDDTFTLHRERTLALLEAIAESGLPSVPGFRWTCNTRPNCVDAALLERMKEVGCAAVAVGIEFGSARMLAKTRKRFTVDDVRRAVRLIKQAGLVASGQFMIGYPTETEAEMWQTARLAAELECESVMLSVATPLPGTPLHDEAVRLGLLPREGIDWATVTTKNDGMLMTIEHEGRTVPMPAEERRRIIGELRREFDRIQAKTLAAKHASRHWYEAQYLPAAEAGPVYGIGQMALAGSG